MTKTLLTAVAIFLGLSILASCHAGKNDPGVVYSPDMYYSQAYESYVPSKVTEDGLSAILPVENTVPYGRRLDGEPTLEPWPFPNLSDADTATIMPAMERYANPVLVTDKGLAMGQKNFGIYCSICHGSNGQGKGYLVTGTTYGQVPANLMDPRFLYGASDAWFYHVLQYGKNSMGSYAYALNREQRWEIVHYIRSLQKTYIAEKEAADAAAALAAASAPPDTMTIKTTAVAAKPTVAASAK